AVARRVAAGDAAATAVWSDTVAVLADALAGIVATVAPRTIIVGGGLAGAGALLFDPLTVELARRIGSSRAPDLIPPHHGDLAAAIGATHLADDLAELIASGSPA
ncbi:ROK family protein, partial [Clavibacter lycopersici]